jgi:hypothetical protein
MTTITEPDGRVVVYVTRRFLPQTDSFSFVGSHRVGSTDRPDLLASKYIGDPLQFWQLCDSNGVMNPPDLTATPGTIVNINLPQGIQGMKTGGNG